VKITYYEATAKIMVGFDEFCKLVDDHFGYMPHFNEFMNEILDNRLKVPAALGLATNPNDLRIMVQSLFHLYAMQKYGCQMYDFHPTLAHMLNATALNVDVHFLRSPHTELMLTVPPDMFTIPDEVNRCEVPVENIYVHFRDDIGGVKQIQILATGMKWKEEQSLFPFTEPKSYWDDTIFFFDLVLRPGVKVEVALSDALDRIEWKGNVKERDGFPRIRALFHYAFNALLYLTSRDAEIVSQLPVNYGRKLSAIKNPNKNKAKIARYEKLENETSKHAVQYVTHKGIAEPSPEPNEKRTATGGKLLTHQYVGGYHRIQWYGSRRDDNGAPRKGDRYETRWIAPYERGGDKDKQNTHKKKVR
jgi:hypothetical protein